MLGLGLGLVDGVGASEALPLALTPRVVDAEIEGVRGGVPLSLGVVVSVALEEKGGSAPEADGCVEGEGAGEGVPDALGGTFPQHRMTSLTLMAQLHVSPALTRAKPPLVGAPLTWPYVSRPKQTTRPSAARMTHVWR